MLSDNRGNVMIPLLATPDYTSMHTNRLVLTKNSIISQKFNRNEEKLGSNSYKKGNVDVATCQRVRVGFKFGDVVCS